MKKLIALIVATTGLAFGGIIANSINYDLNIQLEEESYVTGWMNNETAKTYYQTLLIKPTVSGVYSFYNYHSDLTASSVASPLNSELEIVQDKRGPQTSLGPISTQDTQLLIYTNEPSTIIFDVPFAFNDESTVGFGAQQTMTNEYFAMIGGFDANMFLEQDVEYLTVFTSFQPDAIGSMDVSITGPGTLDISVVPEPVTIGMIGVATGVLLLVRKRREF